MCIVATQCRRHCRSGHFSDAVDELYMSVNEEAEERLGKVKEIAECVACL